MQRAEQLRVTTAGRADATRLRLLDTAERLFAVHGLAAISHRRIAEEAGQANNSAVGYHVGDRRDLVAAIVARHAEPTDRRRAELVAGAAGSDSLRDHVACVVLPMTEHLAELGVPSCYARFAAHAIADPALRELVLAQAVDSGPMRDAMAAVATHTPALPPGVVTIRTGMARHVIVHTCAEAERAFADIGREAGTGWRGVGRSLTDALVGLLSAPSTDATDTPRRGGTTT